jgi:hypothetical protein
MKTRSSSWEAKVAVGLVVVSVSLYFTHFVCFRDLPYIWLSVLTNLAFLPISVLVVTLIIDRLLSARDRAVRLDELKMLISVFFSALGNRLLEMLFHCDASVRQLRNDLGGGDLKARPGRMIRILTSHTFHIQVDKADLEDLRILLTQKMDLFLKLLENPGLHEHEGFAELLRAVFHLTEELSLKDDVWEISEHDLRHLTADINRCYELLVREWSDYLTYLQANYPYLFSLAVRSNPLTCGMFETGQVAEAYAA